MIEDSGKIVGAEVSGSHLRIVILNETSEDYELFETALDRRESVTEQLISYINHVKEKVGDFRKIGIGLSGLIDRRTNSVALSKQMPEYVSVDIAKQIGEASGVNVVLENDANAAAFGEYTLGAGKGNHNLFYIYLGEGVGGAFIIEGDLWRGASGFAGEFGHILINSEDNFRLEDMASTANILRRIRIRIHQDHTSSLAKINEDEITIADVIREANNGDDFTKMMLERTGGYIGTAAASVINLLNIEKIVVGGEIMQAGDPILKGVAENAAGYSFQPSFETTEIVAGTLGKTAVSIGAALLSKQV